MKKTEFTCTFVSLVSAKTVGTKFYTRCQSYAILALAK